MELHPFHTRSLLHGLEHALRLRTVRVHKQGYRLGLRDQFGDKFEPLRMQLYDEKADTREVSAWPCETGYKTRHDRIVAAREDDWDCGSRVFRSKCCEVTAACCNHINLAADEVCGQSW